MDYWQYLDWEVVDDWSSLEEKLKGRRFWLFTKFAEKHPWQAEFSTGDVLVFGSESRGIPDSLRLRFAHTSLRFPMHEVVRSLNLASTVNAALYEAVRQFGGLPH